MNTTPRTNMDKADKGFTLIEVLMALALFSIGILAVASLQVTASLQSRNSSEIADATAIAYSQMDKLMLMPFSDLVSTSYHLIPPANKYKIMWNVDRSHLNNNATIDPKTVELTVRDPMIPAGSKKGEVKFSFIKHR